MAKPKKVAAAEAQTIQAAEVTAATLSPDAPTTPTTTTTSVEAVQLTIADLQLIARIVDLASRRGAFQAGELSQVGEAYNKLAGFLAYVEGVQKAEAASAAAPTTVESTVETPVA